MYTLLWVTVERNKYKANIFFCLTWYYFDDVFSKGEVLAVCGVENSIDVQWFTNDNKTSRHNILDLKCEDEDEDQESIDFYPDHLPVLQKGNFYMIFYFSHCMLNMCGACYCMQLN